MRFRNYGTENNGFSVMDVDELFFISGGSGSNDSSDKNDKDYDTTWELTLSGELEVDTTGKIEPKITLSYVVHK